MTNPIKINDSWFKQLESEFQQDYFKQLKEFLVNEKNMGKTIFPKGAEIFAAFNHTNFDQVKVIVLGQDPYHGEGQANGLSFSVNKGITIPPSLKNIFKELYDDEGIEIPNHGDLSAWAKQGVLLLNSSLTVEKDKPGSHAAKGWEQFTDSVIKVLNQDLKPKVFLLWGKWAESKSVLINGHQHLVLISSHPSPFSVHRGFIGCKHFSKTNAFLVDKGLAPINWNL